MIQIGKYIPLAILIFITLGVKELIGFENTALTVLVIIWFNIPTEIKD